jgi:hypothetical protein
MDRRTPAEHGWPERNCARLVFILTLFAFGLWRRPRRRGFMNRFGFRLDGSSREGRFYLGGRRLLGYTSPPFRPGVGRSGAIFSFPVRRPRLALLLLLNGRTGAVAVGREGGMGLTTVVAAQLIGFVFFDRT